MAEGGYLIRVILCVCRGRSQVGQSGGGLEEFIVCIAKIFLCFVLLDSRLALISSVNMLIKS